MKRRKCQRQTREIPGEEVSVTRESDYIVARAMAGEPRVVSLPPLVFLSTATGDAWVLDAEDNLALRLAAAGTRLPFSITETTERFAIQWAGRFRIDGERMIFVDNAGASRTILGYPTREIASALARARL